MVFLSQEQKSFRYPYQWLDTAATTLLLLTTLLLPIFTLPATRDAIDLPKELLLGGATLAAFLLWLLRGVLAREFYLRRSAVDLPLALFLAAVIVSAFFSASPSVAWLGRMGSFVLHATGMVLFAAFSWLLVQYIRGLALWQVFAQTFCGAGAFAMVLYLLRNISWMRPISSWFGFNTVTQLNSAFGIGVAVFATLALGMLLERGSLGLRHAIPALSAVLAFVTLLRLGFNVAWIVNAVGLALLLLLGASFAREVRIPIMSVLFFLFLISLLFGVTRTPDIIKETLPTEVALSARASWDIAAHAIFSSVQRFLFGSGPGTFVYVFSEFRPVAFNTVQTMWTSRFYRPYNTLFAVLAEIGVIGSVAFVFLFLVPVGMLFAAWRHARAAFIEEDITIRLPVFAVGAAWITATVGLGIAYYTVTLWWMWWVLLALTIAGLSFVVEHTMREHTVLLEVSPQYSLAISFAVILVVAAFAFIGVFSARFFVAEQTYTRAIRLVNVAGEREGLERALVLRPRSVEYRLALASLYFSEAKVEADKGENASSEAIAGFMSAAVAEARLAAEYDPKNVETWETLSLMYLNARVLAADANEWSREATKRAIALEPTNAVLHWRLGNIHEFAKDEDDAEKMYQKAIELKGDYVLAYVSLSNIYEQNNRLDDAINVFAPIAQLFENDPELLFNVGRLFYNRNGSGDNDHAELLFSRAVELQPNYSNAIYSLGLIAERRGDKPEARQMFMRVRDLNPNNPDIGEKLRSL